MRKIRRRRKDTVIIVKKLICLLIICFLISFFAYLIQEKIMMENIMINAECCVTFENDYCNVSKTKDIQDAIFKYNSEETIEIEKTELLPTETKIVKTEEMSEKVTKDTSKLLEEYEDNYDDLLYWLSHIINAEAEGASYENKIACGMVVINRIKDEDYPDTIEEVIFQTNCGIQYQSSQNDRIYLKPNEDSIKAAKEILKGDVEFPSNVVYQAEFKQGSEVYKKIENEYYCYK